MKSLHLFNKLVFIANAFFAFFLLVGYLLPSIPPGSFPKLSVLTLVLPLLVIGNILFAVYWIVQFKKQFIVSVIILSIGFFQEATLFKFFGHSKEAADSFKVMNFNVRMFNHNDAIKNLDVPSRIEEFIDEEQPDIISFQEYTLVTSFSKKDYEYTYIKLQGSRSSFGQAIYSKYKIIEEGSLDFPNSMNNAIYADIVKGNDTIRVYNLHMESLQLQPQIGNLQQEDKKQLLGRLGQSFKTQQEQSELILKHQASCNYPIIISGDFNNTAYSYAYKKLRGDKKDAFEEAGTGFGSTFIFDFIPLRIDFILTDPGMEILDFYNYDEELSDHYPIMAKLKL